MSKRILVLATLLAAGAVSTSALGQATSNQSPANRAPGPPQNRIGGYAIEGEVFREQLDRQALASQPAERVARAEQVAALVDAGKCDEALSAARAQKDHLMARRVREVCKSKSHH